MFFAEILFIFASSLFDICKQQTNDYVRQLTVNDIAIQPVNEFPRNLEYYRNRWW